MVNSRRWSSGAAVGLVCVVIAGSVLLIGQSTGWQAKPDIAARAAKSRPDSNFDEGKVGAYTLPDPLAFQGTTVRSTEAWRPRRAEILGLFRDHVYGRSPGRPERLRFERIEEQPKAMDGAATLTRVAVLSTQAGRDHRFELIIFLPNRPTGPAPVFLLLNNRPVSNTDPTRNEKSEFWPAEQMIARGYGMAAIENGALAPDNAKTFRDGIIRTFEGDPTTSRPDNAWGAVAAWAWGASRAMDYFETDSRIDRTRIGVVGHSRGGKTSLWTGAEDERFTIVVSNESGESGAALARRNFGETIAQINKSFPHWFTARYKTYNSRPDALPVDQHLLMALMAPRAVYAGSADEDLWADPRGEYLSLVHASPVFALWGDPPMVAEAMPPLSQPLIVGRRGYHVRPGTHNLTVYDWERFADFADRVWKK